MTFIGLSPALNRTLEMVCWLKRKPNEPINWGWEKSDEKEEWQKLEQINKNYTIEDNLGREKKKVIGNCFVFCFVFGEKRTDKEVFPRDWGREIKKIVSAQKLITNLINKMQQKITLKFQ